jgi:O-antigen/teichoic acid export membrane protein
MAEVTALCVVGGLLLIWVGGPYLLKLFGSHFASQHSVLIVLGIGTAIQAAGGPSAAILQLTGHEREYVPVVAANVALRLAGFVVLIPWLGVLGAAISATVSLALATIALNILCRRRAGVDPSILVLLRLPSSKRGAYAVRGADSGD